MSNYGFDPNAGPQYGQQYGASQGPYYQPTSDDRTWGMLAHISQLVGLGFIGPLVVWLMYKDKSPFVSDQAKEALNFNLCVLLMSLLLIPTCIGPMILGIGALVYAIIAAMEANKGVWYRYPYIFRMIT
jgi:uncharacterized Tic20 family protein